MLLVLHVLLDDAQGRTPDRRDEVAIGPQRREPRLQPRELLPQRTAAPPLGELDELVDTELRVYLH